MASDLNFSPTKNKETYSFDLNIPPVNDDYVFQIEDFTGVSESVHVSEETNFEDEGSTSIRVISSSSEGTLLIDLNSSSAEEMDTQHFELNLNQVYEENEDHFVGDSGKLTQYFHIHNVFLDVDT